MEEEERRRKEEEEKLRNKPKEEESLPKSSFLERFKNRPIEDLIKNETEDIKIKGKYKIYFFKTELGICTRYIRFFLSNQLIETTKTEFKNALKKFKEKEEDISSFVLEDLSEKPKDTSIKVEGPDGEIIELKDEKVNRTGYSEFMLKLFCKDKEKENETLLKGMNGRVFYFDEKIMKYLTDNEKILSKWAIDFIEMMKKYCCFDKDEIYPCFFEFR